MIDEGSKAQNSIAATQMCKHLAVQRETVIQLGPKLTVVWCREVNLRLVKAAEES